MFSKPIAKPVVLGWLNPLANGWLTIRQDKTRQDKAGFGSSNQNQNPPTCLLVNLSRKVLFLASSFCERIENAKTRPPKTEFSTGFAQSFPQSHLWRCF